MKKKLIQCKRHLFLIIFIAGLHAIVSISFGQVKIQEDSINIPTYVVSDPNPMPRYYEGTSHQGVQRRIYPYPMNDMLSDNKEDCNYHIIRVENEFIELGIMPRLGGRIYYAVDKSN
ncbi:MAG: DUF5107 domain-containing protein, partial [Bacteroidales bacterium]|nr:DUF5107 domain-containing protein [Bacteroidales bacterium]